MHLRELEFELPRPNQITAEGLIGFFKSEVGSRLPTGSRPVRFVVTETRSESLQVELSVIEDVHDEMPEIPDIFAMHRREYQSTERFVAVLLIPTGIGAEIGGHSGDGNSIARLLASACDLLITHPNVLNAADINEMTDNTLYVEGSMIARLIMGQIALERVRGNRLLIAMDKHDDPYFNEAIVNAASAARVTLGLDCDVIEMVELVKADARYSKSGRATAEIRELENLVKVLNKFGNSYDGYALATRIQTPPGTHLNYFKSEDARVNPWGGAEAMLSHAIALGYSKPVAHAPISATREIRDFNFGITDPRKAPEALSVTYLHSVLKGLFRHPRIRRPGRGLESEAISCLIVPDGCLGLPTLAALAQGIPVIVVRENENLMRNDLQGLFAKSEADLRNIFFARSYVEAAGYCALLKAGVTLKNVQRPIAPTGVL